ncbi:glycosyltransferase family 2 protein [Brachyspira intermedia]|uniref:glycosyltransferase family 2 protein n=1 Tax=Brachyspira intermedia TaxID=84377 RepID=UPI0030075836
MIDYPLVSVIITTYNRKKLLVEAINSVLKQDYTNIEIIVSDNASEDGTDLVMQEYILEHKNIKYIRREKNVGPYINAKKAYKEATGKYFIFLSDDDYFISTTFFTNAVKVMEENDKIVIVRGFVKRYFETKGIISIGNYNSKIYIDGLSYLLHYLDDGYDQIETTFGFMRKEPMDRSGIFEIKEKHNHFYDVWTYFYIFLYGDVYFLTDELVGCYRIQHNGNQMSFNFDILKDFDGLIDMSQELIRQAIELHPEVPVDYIKYAVEKKVSDIVWFNVHRMAEVITYDDAIKLLYDSQLLEIYPNLKKIYVLNNTKFNKKTFKINIPLILIEKNETYFILNILGLKLTIKLKK